MNKRTMASFIYEDLRSQILSGQRPYSSKLPSAPQLCGLYNAGISTVKAVMRKLREDGLIRTAERSRPTVVFRPGHAPHNCNDMRMIASQRGQILDIYRTMELLMPEIFTFDFLIPHTLNLYIWRVKNN